MRVIIAKDYEDMSKRAADIIASQLILDPYSVLGLATGGTPVGTYNELVSMYEQGRIDFSLVSTVNLDEYKGLSGDNDQSYRYFMNKNLFSRVNIDIENTYVPNGLEKDEEKAIQDYEDIIESLGGIDLQLLGLGLNGHIGFNEPNNYFTDGVNCVKLTDSTIEANSRFFKNKDEVPTHAYTMGIGSIMRASCVLLIASGKEKADIVNKAFFGKITPEVPASILQLHPNFILLVDEDAMSKTVY